MVRSSSFFRAERTNRISFCDKKMFAKGKNMYGNITKEEQKFQKIKIAFAIKINFMFKKFI